MQRRVRRAARFSPRRLTAPAFGMVMLTLTVAACSSGQAPPPWTTPVLDHLPRFTTRDALPFDAWQLGSDQLTRLHADNARLLQRCADNFEVTLELRSDYIRPPAGTPTLWGGRLGTLDAEHAAKLGYHAGEDDLFARGPGLYLRDPSYLVPAETGDEELDARVAAVFYGPAEGAPELRIGGERVPTGGCLRATEDQIDAPLQSIIDLTAKTLNLAYADPRTTTAIAAWSTCMKDAGYEFADVQEPSESVSTTSPDEAEAALASADVRCTAESRWSDTFYAIVAAYQDEAIAREPSTFTAALDSQRARLASIERLSAG